MYLISFNDVGGNFFIYNEKSESVSNAVKFLNEIEKYPSLCKFILVYK